MSIIAELANENLLYIALQGCRAVIEKELGIKQVIFSMTAAARTEFFRRGRESGELTFPYAFLNLTSLAAIKELQNNYAVQRHGVRFNAPGTRATTAKGYLFPITLGLDFHYIDSEPTRILNIAQSLVLLSVTDGLSFKIDVGDIFSFVVRLEIPLETTIMLEDPNAQEVPGASDVNVQFIMHTTIGFFRDVSAVNSGSPTMDISINGAESFTMDIQIP